MAVILVSCDLKNPARNYEPVFEYLRQFTGCQGLGSTWLLDTRMPAEAIRDTVRMLIDPGDAVLVVRLAQEWAAFGLSYGTWLNEPERNW